MSLPLVQSSPLIQSSHPEQGSHLNDEDLLATLSEQENSIAEETFQCLETDTRCTSSLDSIPLDNPQQPLVPTPPTRQHPLRAILALALHHSHVSSYALDHPQIRALYDNMIPYFASRLHELALGPDVVVAITTAQRCHSLTPHDLPDTFKLHWPYDDGTITSSSDNTILSSVTSQSYPRTNLPGHQVYTKIMSVEPMTLHISDDTPLAILDDSTTDYIRINLGRVIASWATGNFDDMSITHHTETGYMIPTPVTLQLGVNDWPELLFNPRNGAGRSPRCLEPFLASLLNETEHCFPCRPNSLSVVDGQRWGHAVNFSLSKGFNCLRTSYINTFVQNITNGEVFHLLRETPSSSLHMGLPSIEDAEVIKAHDAADAILTKGTPMYLWKHNGCPGRYNLGCYKLSVYQGDIINDSMALSCNLKDATRAPSGKYHRKKKLKNWSRCPTKDNEHLIHLAGKRWNKSMETDASCWVNGVLPPLESA